MTPGCCAWRTLASLPPIVWKPWPIREVDHGMRGGAGIMLDDVMAALMAVVVLLLIRHYT